MKNEVIEEVARHISDSYYDVLLVAFEEQKHKFKITMSIIDFMANLKEKGIVYGLDDIFIDTFIDKMYVEANNYIGK